MYLDPFSNYIYKCAIPVLPVCICERVVFALDTQVELSILIEKLRKPFNLDHLQILSRLIVAPLVGMRMDFSKIVDWVISVHIYVYSVYIVVPILYTVEIMVSISVTSHLNKRI